MCMNCNVPLDAARAEGFAEQMIDMLNQSALTMMVSIGHRTGLFDKLTELPPSTSAQIAEAAGLQERYVREWLGAMTTGRIVEHDAEAGTYALPAEHAAFLTRAAGSDNIATTTQWISVLGGVESKVAGCFAQGGGVPYGAFERFNEVMAEESNLTVVAALFEHILPLVDGIETRLEAGIDVLDVGCGLGFALMAMAERYPNSRFTGYDFSEEAIGLARAETGRRGLTNLTFAVQDAATFTDTETFDLVCTFDSVHDQVRPDAMLANIRRALRPDGVYLMQDIHASSSHAEDLDHPLGPFVYTISTMHCMTVSLANGGAGLGSAWGRATAQRMLDEAGFAEVTIKRLDHDIINDYYIVRPQPAAEPVAA